MAASIASSASSSSSSSSAVVHSQLTPIDDNLVNFAIQFFREQQDRLSTSLNEVTTKCQSFEAQHRQQKEMLDSIKVKIESIQALKEEADKSDLVVKNAREALAAIAKFVTLSPSRGGQISQNSMQQELEKAEAQFKAAKDTWEKEVKANVDIDVVKVKAEQSLQELESTKKKLEPEFQRQKSLEEQVPKIRGCIGTLGSLINRKKTKAYCENLGFAQSVRDDFNNGIAILEQDLNAKREEHAQIEKEKIANAERKAKLAQQGEAIKGCQQAKEKTDAALAQFRRSPTDQKVKEFFLAQMKQRTEVCKKEADRFSMQNLQEQLAVIEKQLASANQEEARLDEKERPFKLMESCLGMMRIFTGKPSKKRSFRVMQDPSDSPSSSSSSAAAVVEDTTLPPSKRAASFFCPAIPDSALFKEHPLHAAMLAEDISNLTTIMKLATDARLKQKVGGWTPAALLALNRSARVIFVFNRFLIKYADKISKDIEMQSYEKYNLMELISFNPAMNQKKILSELIERLKKLYSAQDYSRAIKIAESHDHRHIIQALSS